MPYSVAIDASGNLYIADTGHNAIQEWIAATQQMTPLVTSGLNAPHGVAVDGQGNVFIADSYNNAIKEWSPATQQVTTLVSSGLNFPLGVAVDAQDNVYIADFGNNAIKQWNPSAQLMTTLVASGLNNPTGVAVDALSNVYIADFRHNAIEQWNPANQQFTTLWTQGLSFPNAVTLDAQGNVYLIDGNNNAFKEWSAASQTVNTLVSSGINGSFGVAADGQGNFYIVNTSTSTVLKYSSGYLGLGAVSMSEGPMAGTDSVSVQMLGGALPLTAVSDQAWLTITGATGGSITFAFQANASAASRVAHIMVLGQQVTVTQSGDVAAALTKSAGDGQATPAGQAFPVLLQVTVTDANGIPLAGAAVTYTVTPGANGAGGAFSPTPPMPVLTDQNGNAPAPVLTANGAAGPFTVIAAVNGVAVTFSLNSIGYMLAENSAVVGSAAGKGAVLLVTTGPWVAASNAAWLQIAAGSAAGVGSASIQFTYSTNSNPAAQTGTLSIAGLTYSVTQAGASYVPVTAVSTLVASGLNNPQGVAVDGQGNVYIADTGDNAVKEWTPGATQIVTRFSGLSNPKAVAVDLNGNIYIADTGNNAVEEPGAPSPPSLSGLSGPSGVAVDAQGNIYFSNTGINAVDQWNAAGQQLTTLAGSALNSPSGVAVDVAGNVYFADSGNNSIKEWLVQGGQVNVLVSAGLNNPTGVAVDGQGNVYFADTGNNAIKEWNAASQQLTALVSTGLNGPSGTAVDANGNIYLADAGNNAIKRVTPAYLSLSVTSLNEIYQAGTDSVTAQVLPAGTPLAAVSDQSWLTITGITGGVIGFSFQSNASGANRTAHITVLGLQVAVTQSGDLPANLTKCAGDAQSAPLGQPFALSLQVCVTDAGGNAMAGVPITFSVAPGASGASGTFSASPSMPVPTTQNGSATAPVLTAGSIGGTFTVTAAAGNLTAVFTLTNLVYTLGASSALVPNAAGTGGVLLSAAGSWHAVSNASWLQVSPATAAGSGNALIQFNYSANLNPAAQTGALTISGLTFTVTQAGASFSAIPLVNTLVSSNLKSPQALAVDGLGNVYIVDTGDNAIKEWNVNTLALIPLVTTGLNSPSGVALDSQGNVYIADNKNNAIREMVAATGVVTALVSTGLSGPTGVAVDSQGNVYFSDTAHNQIKEWVAATKAVVVLVSGLNAPKGVAVDALGNVYFADSKNNAIKEWLAISKAVTTLVSGLNLPGGVAVDGDGNVFIADTGNSAIKEWSPETLKVTALVSTGLSSDCGVAVDGQGNVYIADTSHNAVKKYIAAELSLAATSRTEGPLAGSDSIPFTVLPAGTPVTATSNQTWLTISGTAGGAIGFTFLGNTSANNRTAQLTALGQVQVTVTQTGDLPATITKTAGTGQSAVVGHAFTTALQVKVKDASGNAVQNAPVTFTIVPGSKGSSGTFSSSAPVLTNSSGAATASTLTANSVAGTFTVTAAAGTLTTTFTMTITAH